MPCMGMGNAPEFSGLGGIVAAAKTWAVLLGAIGTKSIQKIGANQLCGHTQSGKVRSKKFGDNEAWCIDTKSQHYAILEDGKLSAFPTDGIEITNK